MTENKSNNRTIFSCFLGAFLMLFQIGVYFVYIPWNIERLQISESELGLGLLVFGISNLISNQISGRYIVPNIGTKNSMVLGLFIIAFCPLILVSAPNYSSFLLAHLITYHFCWLTYRLGLVLDCFILPHNLKSL